MFAEIHNAILAALTAAPYRRYTISPKTKQPVLGDLVAAQGLIVRKIYTAFKEAQTRREVTLEISQQLWKAEVEVPGLIDFTEAEDYLSTPIQVEPEGHRRLLVVLQSGHYNTPPDQSPASGSSAAFTFQIYAPTLRK